MRGRDRSPLPARYNFTDDFRNIPVTGGAIFSTLKPAHTYTESLVVLEQQSHQALLANMIFNQVRLSYGRTRLRFEEVRDQEFLIPSGDFPDTPFLLNAPELFNLTLPSAPGVPNSGPVRYTRLPLTVEQ